MINIVTHSFGNLDSHNNKINGIHFSMWKTEANIFRKLSSESTCQPQFTSHLSFSFSSTSMTIRTENMNLWSWQNVFMWRRRQNLDLTSTQEMWMSTSRRRATHQKMLNLLSENLFFMAVIKKRFSLDTLKDIHPKSKPAFSDELLFCVMNGSQRDGFRMLYNSIN